MKITDVKVSIVEVESPPGGTQRRLWQLILVQILTDEGITGNFFGWGDNPSGHVMADTIAKTFKPMLIGRDPFDRESIWQMMTGRSIGGIPIVAVGAVDLALWDIAGKVAGVPVYKLLGGFRDKIRAYASTAPQQSAKACYDYTKGLKEKGFTAIKLHVMGGSKEHLEACHAARDAVGDSIDLMLDSHCRYDRREALLVGRELEKLKFYWYEEPLPNTDIEGYRELCQALDIPIAATETMYFADPAHFTPYMVNHIVDIIRPDAKYGITMTKKIADMCDAFGLKFELHGFGFAACQFANLNIIGSCRSSDFFEKMFDAIPYDACAKDTVQIDKEGFVHMPTKPGLGIEFDFDEIEKRTVLTL
jgi:L-alanine-DL-glutamate epimerase-like enolase superfamily enzyme